MAFDTTFQTAPADKKPNLSIADEPLFQVQAVEPASDELVDPERDSFILHVGLQRPMAAPRTMAQVVSLQTWEGFVTQVEGEEFCARLSDLTDQSDNDEEVVTLSLSEVDQDDRELVRPGGVFRWIIGYHQRPFERRESFSSIVFRRLPAWTAEDLRAAQVQSEKLADAFHWD